MKKMLLSLGALPMTAGIVPARNTALPWLAVARLDTNRNDQKTLQDAATIRNLVESRMADIRQYRIIPGSDINWQLEHARISLKDIRSEKNIRSLQLTRINYIVTGSVDALGSRYAVTLRMLDVLTGQFSHSIDAFVGSSGEALKNDAIRLASAFAADIALAYALTAQEAAAAGFEYKTENKAITITGYTGSAEKVAIPARIDGLPVIIIRDKAFESKQLTSVTIPNGVAVIGEGAFSRNKLTSVTIPNSVVVIGAGAFRENQLTSVTLGNGVTAIGDDAFYHNYLTHLAIPNSVTAIGARAFLRNQLTSLTIGNGVTAIGDKVFSNNRLTSITIPDSITSIGDNAFSSNELTHLTIPNGVTSIGVFAFFNNQLTSLTIGSSVTAIGYDAFCGNQLTHLTIPNGVTSIGDNAFSRNRLTSLTISNSLTVIGDYAFLFNQLTSVTIPANMDIRVPSFYSLLYAHYTASGRKAATYTFERSSSGDFETVIFNNAVEITGYTGSAQTINIPDRIHGLPVTAIGSYVFASNEFTLTSVTIPNGVTVIGAHAFTLNKITSVTIPDGVTTIGEGAFSQNNLTSVTLGNGVTVIEKHAFYVNQLSSVTIPNGVTVIGEGAFFNNPLSSITIPANVNVRTDAFPGNLAGVYVDGGRRVGTFIAGNRGMTWSRQ